MSRKVIDKEFYRVAVIADLHADNHPRFATPLPDGTNTRLRDGIDALKEAHTWAASEGADSFFILGDLFNKKRKIDVCVYNVVYAVLDEYDTGGPEIILLVGNHDWALKSGVQHSLKPLAKAVSYVVDNHVIEVVEVAGKAAPFCVYEHYFPYTSDAEVLTDWFAASADVIHRNESGAHIIYGHLGILEGVVGPSQVRIGGEISLAALGGFDLGLFGHYHKPQDVAPNIFYVGSPYQLDFGERDEDKSVLIADVFLDEDEFKFEVKRMPLMFAPRFEQIELGDDMPSDADLKDFLQGNFVKVVTTPEHFEDGIAEWATETFGAAGVVVEVETEPENADRGLGMDADMSADEAIKAYVEATNTELDSDELVKVGMTLIDEAKQRKG